jgi:hypothetical protein
MGFSRALFKKQNYLKNKKGLDFGSATHTHTFFIRHVHPVQDKGFVNKFWKKIKIKKRGGKYKKINQEKMGPFLYLLLLKKVKYRFYQVFCSKKFLNKFDI